MAEFEYPQLSTPDHFRVLHLQPAANSTEAPSFTLKEVPYDRPPPYAAISYTWDGQDFDTEAYCDGMLFKVTQNCCDILRCLRKGESTVTIWLDQICINQKSDADKSIHVARMDEIYERCTEVLIWMSGLPDDAVSVLMRVMERGDRRPSDAASDIYTDGAVEPDMTEAEQDKQTAAESI